MRSLLQVRHQPHRGIRMTISNIFAFVMTCCVGGMAFAQYGDDLSRSLAPPALPPIPGLPDVKQPIFLKTGALVCRNEEALLGASNSPTDDQRNRDNREYLRRTYCSITNHDIAVRVLIPRSYGDDYLRQSMFKYVEISWQNSDGTFGSGWTGMSQLRN